MNFTSFSLSFSSSHLHKFQISYVFRAPFVCDLNKWKECSKTPRRRTMENGVAYLVCFCQTHHRSIWTFVRRCRRVYRRKGLKFERIFSPLTVLGLQTAAEKIICDTKHDRNMRRKEKRTKRNRFFATIFERLCCRFRSRMISHIAKHAGKAIAMWNWK